MRTLAVMSDRDQPYSSTSGAMTTPVTLGTPVMNMIPIVALTTVLQPLLHSVA